MTRLIDADAIPYREIWREDWLNNAGKYQQGVFRDEIEEMPTVDAVQVIRCKDCRFRNQFGFCHRWLWVSAPKMEDDEYCSGAERKEE